MNNRIVLPEHLIDESRIDDVNVLGRGGRERDIAVLLPTWRRVGAALYDYETEYDGRVLKLEVKKQANLQWFDSGKYYLLNEQNRDIIVLFVNHFDGRIESIAAAQLGAFIDLLISTPQYRAFGWTEEVMSIAADFKIRYPSLQFKAKASIVTMMQNHPSSFQVLYDRQTPRPF
jgi:hypothetical protein